MDFWVYPFSKFIDWVFYGIRQVSRVFGARRAFTNFTTINFVKISVSHLSFFFHLQSCQKAVHFCEKQKITPEVSTSLMDSLVGRHFLDRHDSINVLLQEVNGLSPSKSVAYNLIGKLHGFLGFWIKHSKEICDF